MHFWYPPGICLGTILDAFRGLGIGFGTMGYLGEVLEVSETGLGIHGISVIIQGVSRIRSTLKVGGDLGGLGCLNS